MQDDHDQVKLRLVPKPEGFELRNKRSDKSCDASDWQVGDALYEASLEISKQECSTVMILWTEVREDGKTVTHHRYSGKSGDGERLFLNGLGKFMGWVKPE